ncbi:MAG: ribosome biogenesis GTP-binding protein YihA/YsxC [Bacilli bacterium]|nr:ribosome biogenesis GTP-binding protein YihA/YsxC [Bacilli bacterium]
MQINSVDLKSIAVRTSQYPEDELPEFLLVGRSNVGKSSFINCLIERKNYAHTSSKPGKTTTLNFYLVNNKFYIVDVPGYGYALGGKEKQRKFGMMIEEYLKTRKSMKKVFLLIDYRHKPTEDDCLMYNFLKYYNIDVEVVATKYDKVNKSGRIKQDKIINETLHLTEDRPFIPFSTVTKKGKEDVYAIIEKFL